MVGHRGQNVYPVTRNQSKLRVREETNEIALFRYAKHKCTLRVTKHVTSALLSVLGSNVFIKDVLCHEHIGYA